MGSGLNGKFDLVLEGWGYRSDRGGGRKLPSLEPEPRPITLTREVEVATPMQLTAWHVYVPSCDSASPSSPSFLCDNANTSPGLISLPSLNHLSTGVGTPTHLHSSETVPASVNSAWSSSKNSGFL